MPGTEREVDELVDEAISEQRNAKDILIEMKDTSELMVDLAYSALLTNSKAIAEEVAQYRNDADEDTLGQPGWYKDAVPGTAIEIAGIITIRSNHFLITSTGHFGGSSKRVEAAVQRDEKGFKILSWKME